MTGALTRGQARFAVALLFGVNFLNYIDRYVIAAVLPLIQQEFHLDDARAGYVLSMFVLVYMAASPFTGVMGDRWPRRAASSPWPSPARSTSPGADRSGATRRTCRRS